MQVHIVKGYNKNSLEASIGQYILVGVYKNPDHAAKVAVKLEQLTSFATLSYKTCEEELDKVYPNHDILEYEESEDTKNFIKNLRDARKTIIENLKTRYQKFFNLTEEDFSKTNLLLFHNFEDVRFVIQTMEVQ